MTQMVRKQIYIPKRLNATLKRIARQRGISEAELIRHAIDRDINGGATRPFRPDPEAWAKAYRFMLARRALVTIPAQPYRWKREDAYEERLSRYDRKLNSSQ